MKLKKQTEMITYVQTKYMSLPFYEATTKVRSVPQMNSEQPLTPSWSSVVKFLSVNIWQQEI